MTAKRGNRFPNSSPESPSRDRRPPVSLRERSFGRYVMASRHQWSFGATTLQRVVESEGPLLPPFEIYGDCTQAHLDQHRKWLVPRFQDAGSGLLLISIQSFLIRQDGLTILVDTC